MLRRCVQSRSAGAQIRFGGHIIKRWAFGCIRFQRFDWLTGNLGTRKISRVAFRWWRKSRFSSSSDSGCICIVEFWQLDEIMTGLQNSINRRCPHIHLHTTELLYTYIANTYKKNLLSYTPLFSRSANAFPMRWHLFPVVFLDPSVIAIDNDGDDGQLRASPMHCCFLFCFFLCWFLFSRVEWFFRIFLKS